MNSVDSAYHSQSQSASTPCSETPDPKGIVERYPGEKIKMSSSTPNGYNNVSNYKPKSDEHSKKHHDSSKHSDHKHSNSSQHNSDHAKRKDGDSSKLSSSSKPKDGLNKSSHDGQHKSKDHHHEKKHEHSKSSSDKLKKEKSSTEKSSHDSLKKVDKHRDDKHKERVKDGHSSEHKHKDKTKEHDRTKDDKPKDPSKVKKVEGHKDKHSDKPRTDKPLDKGDKPKDKIDKPKDKSDKPKDKSDRPKEKSSSDKPKEKSDKPKDKIDRPKDKSDKPKDKGDKPKEKSDKPKDKSDKPKEKSLEKPKEKSKENADKSKDKIGEKSKDKSSDHFKDKKRDGSPEKKGSSPSKEHSKKPVDKGSEMPKTKPQPTSPIKISIKVEPSSPLSSPVKPKEDPFSDDDVPLSTRKPVRDTPKPIKRQISDEESDDEPLSARISKAKKVKTEKNTSKKRKAASEDEDYEEYDSDYKKPKKKVKRETKPKAAVKKEPASQTASPKKGRAKKEDDQDVWKWWEEEKQPDGIKWRTLEHKGPVFAPGYERVPKGVKFYYDGKHMELSEVTEEVAGFYGRMLDHDYTSKDAFNTNFFKDWRKVMTPQERETIKDLRKCNFKDFDVYYKQKSEERKSMTKEEKQEIKKQNAEMVEEYGFCIIDGHRQKIGNFKIEPPGLFRGRGEHPKMGMLKRRVQPEDILINIGREGQVPEPPAGHKWKEIRHDNTVTWLASWNENILNSTKYIMLNPSSKLKGEKDWAKYETARKLKNHADRIRNTYEQDFKSKEMKVRQRAVALYFIDKLALRAGNEKDEDTADTVGCCSLRVEHITLDEERNGQEYVVSFDFLGKDSIRYENSVPVEKRAFKNLKLFMENKQPGDDLFDRLNTGILNKYLTELMDGLTAKVFRTYNASKTLQEQLDLLTKEEMSVPEKLLAYNRANRSVAVLCNHQRSIPKTFDKSMENLKNKIDEKLELIKNCKKEVKQLKSDAKHSGKDKVLLDKKKKRLQQLEEQLQKLEVQATDKEENKQIALGTSKLNYLDPRISVAWCKKWNVPIEKIYNRTQRDKFRWAIEMAGPEFHF